MNKPNRRTILLLFTVALVFRLTFAFYFHTVKAADSFGYIKISENIMEGRFFPDLVELQRQPGYPLFMVSILSIWNRLGLVMAVQQVLSAVTVVMIYLISRLVFGERSARWAGWLTALNPALAYYGCIILMETFMIFLVTLATLFLLIGIKNDEKKWFLFAGLVTAYAVWTKPILMLVGFCFVPLVILSKGLRTKWLNLLSVVIPMVLVFVGWSYRNYIVVGAGVYAPSFGLNLLERTAYLAPPHTDSPEPLINAYRLFDMFKAQEAIGDQDDSLYWSFSVIQAWREAGISMGVAEMNDLFAQIAIGQIRANPGGYILTIFRELAYTWAGYTPHWAKWRPTSFGEFTDWSFFFLGPLLGVAMVGLFVIAEVRAIRDRNWTQAWFGLPVILVTVATAMLIPSDYRYRLVVEPYVLVLVSYGLLVMTGHIPDGETVLLVTDHKVI